MPILLIDVETHDAKRLKRMLERLVSTNEILSMSEYRIDRSYTQIVVDTTKTEDQMDNWLYKSSNVDYVGVIEYKPIKEKHNVRAR